MQFLMILLIVLTVGLWFMQDANRLSKHVRVAEKLILEGVPEDEAMERSGCNHWDTPWFRRFFMSYPELR